MRYKVDAEEKVRAKYFMDRLAPLGGFIGEEVEAKMMSVYPSEVISAVKKYSKSGKEILLVAEKVIAVRNEISTVDLSEGEIISHALLMEHDYEKWFLEQNIMAELELLQNPDSEKSGYPELFSALEKKILDLYLEKRFELAQIAEELDCGENDEYVVMLLQYMKKRMMREGIELEALDDRLEEEQLELDW